MCECRVAAGKLKADFRIYYVPGKLLVVAAGNLRTDFRFWRGAGKLVVNGSRYAVTAGLTGRGA